MATKSLIKLRFLVSVPFFFTWVFIQAQSAWIEKSEIPVPRYQAVAFCIDQFIYVGTGMIGSKVSNDFWRYEPESDTWREIDSMPTNGRRGAFAFVISGKGYIGGGIGDQWTKDNEFWEYDPNQSTWTRRADLPLGLDYDFETIDGFSIGSKGYFVAPYSRPNFFMYNPDLDSWSEKKHYPGKKAIKQFSFVIAEMAYIGGGYYTDHITEFWAYNPNNDRWAQMANLPGLPRAGAVGFSVGNYGYMGLGRHHSNFLYDFWKYDKVTNTWVSIDSCFTSVDFAIGIGTTTRGYIGTGYKFSEDSGWWEFTPRSTGTESRGPVSDFQLVNNLAQDMLFLKSKSFSEGHFSIYSLSGQMVKTGRLVTGSISINDLPPALYLLKIQIDQKTINLKFLKY